MLTVQCKLEYTASLAITDPLSSCIGSGKPFDYFDITQICSILQEISYPSF